MTILVRPLAAGDRDAWLAARAALWPDADPAELAREVEAHLGGARDVVEIVFVADADGPVGFVELSLRPYVDGCAGSPVPYVEAWWVAPAWRRRGLGRGLIAAAARWAQQRGCTELASDALIENSASIAAHTALGFAETGRIVQFRMDLSR